jgi:hypothetical protein
MIRLQKEVNKSGIGTKGEKNGKGKKYFIRLYLHNPVFYNYYIFNYSYIHIYRKRRQEEKDGYFRMPCGNNSSLTVPELPSVKNRKVR